MTQLALSVVGDRRRWCVAHVDLQRRRDGLGFLPIFPFRCRGIRPILRVRRWVPHGVIGLAETGSEGDNWRGNQRCVDCFVFCEKFRTMSHYQS
jgi:hypothetical protein